MREVTFNVPINNVSFGQVSTSLLREAYKREMSPLLFPIGGGIDLASHAEDHRFSKWIQEAHSRCIKSHSRDNKTIKLWHMASPMGPCGLEGPSDKHLLYTFYELDSPTEPEKNVMSNTKTAVSSSFTKAVFEKAGCEVHFVPLGFDNYNFHPTDKEYFKDGRITFNLCGKFEHRKHHAKILKAWVKEFGDNAKYHLQCALYNPFLDAQQNNGLLSHALEGKRYANVTFLNHMPKNSLYNDFLNSGDIIIGMSGGEGWSLPEFQSVCLGAHGVILNAHAYKDWANEENSVMVQPSDKISAIDNIFFNQGSPINQGYIFNWKDEDFIEGCHKAIERVEKSDRKNKSGLKLGEEMTYEKTLSGLLELAP